MIYGKCKYDQYFERQSWGAAAILYLLEFFCPVSKKGDNHKEEPLTGKEVISFFFWYFEIGKTELEINGKRNLLFLWYFEMWENKIGNQRKKKFFILLVF